MIRIVNLKCYVPKSGEVLVKVDRSSPLGNPFKMYSESDRDLVCRKYEEYMQSKVKDFLEHKAISKNDISYIIELNRIIQLAKQGKDIALGCWCYPKRCHSESIKALVEQYI